MFNWLSYHRADIAAVLIIILAIAFLWSIFYGIKETKKREHEQVFGDPERTFGGWYWAVCGVSALLLIWFYYSWGMARAFFPNSANEICQIAKIDEALSPIHIQLPLDSSRYYKSTRLVLRNVEQLDSLKTSLPVAVFLENEQAQLLEIIENSKTLIAIYSNEENQSAQTTESLSAIASDINVLSERVYVGHDGLVPSDLARQQLPWGVDDTEIGLLAKTPRGVLFDQISVDAKGIADRFLRIRNTPQQANILIDEIRVSVDEIKAANRDLQINEADKKARTDYIKSVERVFKRLDDGTIFSSTSLVDTKFAIENLNSSIRDMSGSLRIIDALFMPGNVVKSKTLCVEQGSSRWLPKPTDVVSKFGQLANPDLASGGGYKGTVLLWWKWLAISDVVAFFIPDFLVDMLPGEYGYHDENGGFVKTYKDRLLAVAQGDIYLGAIPMLDGHIWDSLFRVLVAMAFGIIIGVPLGIYMGISRFFKSFFDPLIELYRPVPPLAWAPLILTIFGIQDDGKIFLLFMVSFAIMVISARTGASGTKLSKIRASHSLGASNRQIVRYVILPNALPEILTGVRIAIGVCWGTLVAAEMLAGTTGIGFIENVARTVSDYELIWVTILIMGLLGLLFDMIMRYVINILIPWRGKG